MQKKQNSLWLSRGSCLGLLTREWGLPAELITACLHEYRRNTSSSTHNILILLSSPSVPPPSAPALICNRAHCEGGVYVYNQIRTVSPLCPHQTSKSITVLLMKAQALTGRPDIRNSTFTMLQVCSTFSRALTPSHAGLCSHLDVSICGKFSTFTSSLGSPTSHECKSWQTGCINHCTPGEWLHSTLAGLSERG